MALRSKSSFLYGYQITNLNRSLDFRAVVGGPILLAQIRIGYYSLTTLLTEIKRALEAADALRTYTATANRNVSGGTQNRVTISTSGTYFDLLFATGPRIGSSIAPIIGFTNTDQVGGVSYVGTLSTGTLLITEREAYSYIAPEQYRTVNGSVSISAIGEKEAIVWGIQEFCEGTWREETGVKVNAEWAPFLTWAIKQISFDFTPEISSPNSFYNVTLEATGVDGKGLGYKFKEMLPDKPFYYDTGNLRFRKRS